MKNKREYVILVCVVIFGIAFGVLAKAGDVAVQGSIFGDLLYAFGVVSTGFFVWVAACTAIAVLSENRIWAGVNVLIFLTAMIIAYYLYSYFVVGYLVWRVVKFWLIMLIPSAILGSIVWNVRTSRVLKYTVIALGTAVMIFDMFIIQGGIAVAMVMDIVLYAVFLAFVQKAH